MEGLVIRSESLYRDWIGQLPPDKQATATAHFLGKRITNGNEDLKLIGARIAYWAYAYGCQDITPQQIDVFTRHVAANFVHFTLEEIDRAFNDYATNPEHPIVHRFTVVFISHILNEYNAKRGDIIQRVNQMAIAHDMEQKNRNRVQDVDWFMKDQICEAFDDYSTTKTVYDYGGAKYNYLTDKKHLSLSIEAKRKIYEDARQELLQSVNQKYERDYKAMIASLDIRKAKRYGSVEDIDPYDPELVRICYEKSICLLFDSLIEQGKHIREIINQTPTI